MGILAYCWVASTGHLPVCGFHRPHTVWWLSPTTEYAGENKSGSTYIYGGWYYMSCYLITINRRVSDAAVGDSSVCVLFTPVADACPTAYPQIIDPVNS